MNRIYQGRVTKVERPNGKGTEGKQQWQLLEEWPEKRWRHHELFQDVVNSLNSKFHFP
jgi:hypothetical protein